MFLISPPSSVPTVMDSGRYWSSSSPWTITVVVTGAGFCCGALAPRSEDPEFCRFVCPGDDPVGACSAVCAEFCVELCANTHPDKTNVSPMANRKSVTLARRNKLEIDRVLPAFNAALCMGPFVPVLPETKEPALQNEENAARLEKTSHAGIIRIGFEGISQPHNTWSTPVSISRLKHRRRPVGK